VRIDLTESCIPHHTSTERDRTPGHHQGRMSVQPQIVVGKRSNWEVLQQQSLSGVSELDTGDGDSDRRVIEELGGIGHDDYETESGGEGWVGDAVAVDWNRRMPT
jgi:hypothetical protein